MRTVVLLLTVVTFLLCENTGHTETTRSGHIQRCLPEGLTWRVEDGGKNAIKMPGQESAMEIEFVFLVKGEQKLGLNWLRIYNTDGRESWTAGSVLDTMTGLGSHSGFYVARDKLGKYPYILAGDKKGEIGNFLYLTLNSPEYGKGLIVLTVTSSTVGPKNLLELVKQLDLACLAMEE